MIRDRLNTVALQGRISRAGIIRATLLAGLVTIVWFAPHATAEVVAVAVAVAGALAVWAATQPVLLTFTAGLWAGYRLARRRGWTP